MWLLLAFRQCVRIPSTAFYGFLHILPPELFMLLCQRTVPFANESKFFVKARYQTWSAIGFENFQRVPHGFLGCQFLEKYRIFYFDWFLKHLKKFQGILQWLNMFGHIFRCTLKIYIVLYSYKLSLTSYVGLKIKQNLKFLQFLRFFHF